MFRTMKKPPAAALLVLMAVLGTAQLAAQTQTQYIDFSGYRWMVRRNDDPQGPMDNRFGPLGVNVFLRADGALILKIAKYNGYWYSGEVDTVQSFGYGTYTFQVETPIPKLHPDVIVGLFNYKDSRNEIDIEFSSWGWAPEDIVGDYCVQPWTTPGNLQYFDIKRFTVPSTHQFVWTSTRIDFYSWIGYGPKPPANDPSLVTSWSYTNQAGIPKTTMPVLLNFYLFDGKDPRNYPNLLMEVVIKSFTFTPLQ